MPLVVLEGGDGVGKSTQFQLLRERLEAEGYRVQGLHFPRLDAWPYGDLIASFLRGEFGGLESVHPRLVALLYAGDRAEAKEMLEEWLEAGEVVLLDRYYASNLAYQAAKVQGSTEQGRLIEWMLRLELQYFGIPAASVTIYLDAPRRFTDATLAHRASDEVRDYLAGLADIHEQNADYQDRVRAVFRSLGDFIAEYHVVDCAADDGGLLPRTQIATRIWEVVARYL